MATLNDLGPLLQRKLEKAVRQLPEVLVGEAVTWTRENFTRQGWPGRSFQKWKQRQPGAVRNRGRSILINTGSLKRSIRKIATGPLSASFGTDVPYAKAHNSGFKGTLNVKAHSRVKRAMTVRGMEKKRTVVGVGKVKAHQRRMNLPQRRFIGYSPVLQSILRRKAAVHIGRTLKS
jgi:phage gpG-like protein